MGAGEHFNLAENTASISDSTKQAAQSIPDGKRHDPFWSAAYIDVSSKKLLAQAPAGTDSTTNNAASPKSKVLQGSLTEEQAVDVDAEKKRLMGQLKQEQGYLKAGEGKYDTSDPDAGDEELKIAWKKWHEDFLTNFGDFHEVILNSPGNTKLIERKVVGNKIQETTSTRFPPGLVVEFMLDVSKDDHKINNFQISQGSGNAEYDATVKAAIMKLDGSPLLAFPRGSQRTSELVAVHYSLTDDKNQAGGIYVPDEIETIKRHKR